MSRPHHMILSRTLDIGGSKRLCHSVNTGVPHVITFVEELESGKIAIRTYERGVETETLACGTGVTAAGLIYAALSDATSPVLILVRGGDWLEVGFEKVENSFEHVTLKGPADFAFEGSTEII